MFNRSFADARLTVAPEGTCLGCTTCNGGCFEIIELLTIPPRVLKTKGK